MKDEKGDQPTGATWSGKLIDANGRQGTIEINAGTDNKQSSWRVRVASRDGEPSEMKGESDVTYTGGNLKMKSKQEVAAGKTVEWEIDLQAGPAGSYAKSAMVGRYAIRGASENSLLSQGVMILWQFQ